MGDIDSSPSSMLWPWSSHQPMGLLWKLTILLPGAPLLSFCTAWYKFAVFPTFLLILDILLIDSYIMLLLTSDSQYLLFQLICVASEVLHPLLMQSSSWVPTSGTHKPFNVCVCVCACACACACVCVCVCVCVSQGNRALLNSGLWSVSKLCSQKSNLLFCLLQCHVAHVLCFSEFISFYASLVNI